MVLPKDFIEKLRSFPGNIYNQYETLLEEQVFAGFRVNTLKCSMETVLKEIKGTPVPFCSKGFYLGENRKGLGNHPLHHAGAFYIQEPSAMSAVTALSPKPGDRVLDLCAAPGGKSTQIAAELEGQGLLIANEFVGSRAKILGFNIERMGIANAVITCEHPDTLCSELEGFFNKILVDAPCSGEGMFRKDPEAVQNWSQANVETCAARQLKILESASVALAKGGILCYSTCTFSPEENEGVVSKFLKLHHDFQLISIVADFGMSAFPEFGGENFDISLCRRVFPMHGGEGHFLALFRREGETDPSECTVKGDTPPVEFLEFWNNTFLSPIPKNIRINRETVYIVPNIPKFHKVKPIRTGVFAGQILKKRFEPSHGLFMCPEFTPKRILDLDLTDDRIAAFLHGEQIGSPELDGGYASVRVLGVPCGFGKVSGGVLKNHYPKGLRTLK